jgi:hypothetical protein
MADAELKTAVRKTETGKTRVGQQKQRRRR